MNYELAQKLRGAGFPQNMTAGSKVFYQKKVYIHLGGGHNGNEGLYAEQAFTCCLDEYNKEDSDVNINSSILNIMDSLTVFIPTLSELIDACGDKFFRLVRWEEEVLTIRWSAADGKNRFDGRTAEEAVANLWLDLNKK